MSGAKHITIHTDGSSKGNPGPGGYGILLNYEGNEKEISGGFRKTTNNRMELAGPIVALRALKQPCLVTLFTDSKYVVGPMSRGWAMRWRQNAWIGSNKKPVKNIDLWEDLLLLCDIHDVEFVWAKGHAGNVENERCHRLAFAAAGLPNPPADEGYEAEGSSLLGARGWWAVEQGENVGPTGELSIGAPPRAPGPRAIRRAAGPCVACGSPKGLHVHHADWSHANRAAENLEVLCEWCHMQAHKLGKPLFDKLLGKVQANPDLRATLRQSSQRWYQNLPKHRNVGNLK